ncbi:hypothetical protein PCANB_002823 [Pneumocystis canis]|nr:hypothetical protein PCK1_002991 [Pneumocystis canis]KAG5438335.1 hypothetical protein PCANB_002823 [Pneumocystis canis]
MTFTKVYLRQEDQPPDYTENDIYSGERRFEQDYNIYSPLLNKQPISQINNIPEDFKYGTSVYQCDISIRMDFIRKVYSILFFQIIGSTLFSTILITNDTLKTLIIGNSWAIIGSMIGSIATFFFLFWKRYNYPLNFYLLTLFTLLESCSIGAIKALYITTGIFLGLTLFTWQNKYDFSSMGGYLYVGFMFLFSGGLVFLFFPYNRMIDLMYAGIGTFVFSGYILYDTSMLMKRLSPEDYIIGSVSLYIDIVNLFLQILNLIAKLNEDD